MNERPQNRNLKSRKGVKLSDETKEKMRKAKLNMHQRYAQLEKDNAAYEIEVMELKSYINLLLKMLVERDEIDKGSPAL